MSKKETIESFCNNDTMCRVKMTSGRFPDFLFYKFNIWSATQNETIKEDDNNFIISVQGHKWVIKTA